MLPILILNLSELEKTVAILFRKRNRRQHEIVYLPRIHFLIGDRWMNDDHGIFRSGKALLLTHCVCRLLHMYCRRLGQALVCFGVFASASS